MSTEPKESNNEQDNEKYTSYKLVILGEVAVGKTSIAQRYSKFNKEVHEPTVGALFLTRKIKVEDKNIKYDIWDTAGQERYHSLTPMYYKNAKAAIVVFDVSSVPSFERAQKWTIELQEKADKGIVIALCGNKCDLEERKVTKEEAEEYANKIGSFYMEVSAKLNTNIEALFHTLGERLPKIEEKKPLLLSNEGGDEKGEKKRSCYGYCG